MTTVRSVKNIKHKVQKNAEQCCQFAEKCATCKVPCAMSYRNLKIHLKKFVHVCVVNVIHAKVLPGSVL